MALDHLKIGFVRRGYSSSGGAEAYLKRLAAGVRAAGHEPRLFTTAEWPAAEWPSGPVTRLEGRSPRHFADELDRYDTDSEADLLMSLERVWACDILRAGDGVHRAWLERRAAAGGVLQKIGVAVHLKHRSILRLERSLLGSRCAHRVIANSRMVRDEIIAHYRYPAERIDVVYNGVPTEWFRAAPDQRARARQALGLEADHLAVLFVGSGWERKGLRWAIKAIETAAIANLQLLVAGRGDQAAYPSPHVRFLDAVKDTAALYAAADIFLLPTIYDPFSNACLEAAAAGLPVITTKANGFAEIIEDGVHGSVIENPTETDALISALRFWSETDRRAGAKAGILELASRYDIASNVAATLKILTHFAASAESTSGKIRNT